VSFPSILEDVAYTLTITATDDDPSLILTMSATNLPTGSSFVDNGDNTGTFSWTPTLTQAGTYNPVFHASDGRLTTDYTVTITVEEWAERMIASYVSLHTTLPAGVEAELLSRLQPGGYLYTTFGPKRTGQVSV
jgi:hypothetical protein